MDGPIDTMTEDTRRQDKIRILQIQRIGYNRFGRLVLLDGLGVGEGWMKHTR